MFKRTKFISISAVVLISIIITAVIINSPYYPGFESGLHYLSPDLSEYRAAIRDSVFLSRESDVKIVFEKKNIYISYDREQFYSFINSVVIQVWNETEYFSFNRDDLDYKGDYVEDFQLNIGSLKGTGKYNIYIKSDNAINATYNIGVGIGNESKFIPIGKNVRDFY
ncbi:MAG: hypothetical protein OCD02_18150 [Spirochaetaceae bacterium]